MLHSICTAELPCCCRGHHGGWCLLQEEMKRGYFDDFKDLKETQGRMFEPSTSLLPPEASAQLPTMAVSAGASVHALLSEAHLRDLRPQNLIHPCFFIHGSTDCHVQMVEPAGAQVAFPPPHGTMRAGLLTIAFRAGAEVDF